MDQHPSESSAIYSVFHPTDFSDASMLAFAHALKIALSIQGKLDILHVDTQNQADWEDFPGVRQMLERWGSIPPKSDRQAVIDLGIQVHKAILEQSDPVAGTLSYLEKHPADLIVLAVHTKDGRMSWLRRSVGEPIGRRAQQAVLFLPVGVQGFVSPSDGHLELERILIPICDKPDPQPSIDALEGILKDLKFAAGRVTALHVGDESSMPPIEIPKHSDWDWDLKLLPGDPVGVIVDYAKEINAGLIVMATDGRDGFLDALRGSHSERVLRHAHCPLLIIPVGSRLDR
jgi:nucleotide-binding universal stress UspA family protein